MQRLMRKGTYSFTARTILLSITLPSHTSMLTGVEPEVHGVTEDGLRMTYEYFAGRERGDVT